MQIFFLAVFIVFFALSLVFQKKGLIKKDISCLDERKDALDVLDNKSYLINRCILNVLFSDLHQDRFIHQVNFQEIDWQYLVSLNKRFLLQYRIYLNHYILLCSQLNQSRYLIKYLDEIKQKKYMKQAVFFNN